MFDPHSPLGERLKAHRVRVRSDGPDTLILQNVPANPRYFNKPGTNMMVKRARASLPFLIAVDADLAYAGPDPILSRAFAAGTTEQGWRIVFLDPRGEEQWAEVVEDALRAVGFEGEEPRWSGHEGPDSVEEAGLLGEVRRRLDIEAVPTHRRQGRRSQRGDVRAAAGVRPDARRPG